MLLCGIIGILGNSPVSGSILESLRRLEYRGYDSAGLATIDNGRLGRRRAAGKLAALAEKLDAEPLGGLTGVGHTRWATHGAATEQNAHPHMTDRLALVHNGIIENFHELRSELKTSGVSFSSETDTEVCAQLVTHYLSGENLSPREAFAKMLTRLKGAFGIAAIFSGEDDLLIGARRGSPLAVGRGDGEMFLGSDAYALAPFTNRITYLEDGDWVVLTRETIEIMKEDGTPAQRSETISPAGGAPVRKDGHRHFMAKEIHEQPEVVGHTLARYIDPATDAISLPESPFDFATIPRLTISACGTAYYAGAIAKYWFETFAGLSVELDVASELRYRDVPYQEGGGALFISQSGETADTLAALRDAKKKGQRIAAVVNVSQSSIAREADIVLPIAAGPEIGVASTKAFTCQLAALAAIAVHAGLERNVLSKNEAHRLARALLSTPRLIAEALGQSNNIELAAKELAKASTVLFVGRGLSFPLAMEGALKLKEISYIHAEGYPAGELKHGPIALIDKSTPTVVIAPPDKHREKTLSNAHEVRARDGRIILFTDDSSGSGIDELVGENDNMIAAPPVEPLFSALVYAPLVQLLAYHTAAQKGTDIDQPRNLAKSVTVE